MCMDGAGGVEIKRIMRLQGCEATKQEFVALNELVFCLRTFDYLGGMEGVISFTVLILILL